MRKLRELGELMQQIVTSDDPGELAVAAHQPGNGDADRVGLTGELPHHSFDLFDDGVFLDRLDDSFADRAAGRDEPGRDFRSAEVDRDDCSRHSRES